LEELREAVREHGSCRLVERRQGHVYDSLDELKKQLIQYMMRFERMKMEIALEEEDEEDEDEDDEEDEEEDDDEEDDDEEEEDDNNDDNDDDEQDDEDVGGGEA
jgi:hypothetical protein